MLVSTLTAKFFSPHLSHFFLSELHGLRDSLLFFTHIRRLCISVLHTIHHIHCPINALVTTPCLPHHPPTVFFTFFIRHFAVGTMAIKLRHSTNRFCRKFTTVSKLSSPSPPNISPTVIWIASRLFCIKSHLCVILCCLWGSHIHLIAS